MSSTVFREHGKSSRSTADSRTRPYASAVTADGVDALRADRDVVLALTADLAPSEWQAPSDCDGWRVQDVIAHLANTCRAVADPAALAPGVPGDLEASQDAQVAAHRDWTPDEVAVDYAAISTAALDLLEQWQGPPPITTLVSIDDAGHHPLHLVANALAFDHFCHLRNDILKPLGPIDRPAPPADDLRVRATLEWLMAGLPQMSSSLNAVLTEPFGVHLTGAGAGSWTIAQDDGGIRVDGGASAVTTVRGSTTDFVIWATHRRPWREFELEISGDHAYASTVLDAIHLF
jgi:uncharacterized protein (TIGR03083 family)